MTGNESVALVVEDDPHIADLVAMHLRDLGFETEQVSDGSEAQERVTERDYGFIVLDIMLPGVDGFEVCKAVRQRSPQTPVLFLTARTDELDRVLGLELGADDYLTKPFGVREFVARVKALLRRIAADHTPADGDRPVPLRLGSLTIDPGKRKVIQDERDVSLTAKEFDLLLHFARHPGQAFTRTQLLEAVWGYTYEGYDHTVNSHINRLRAKIEDDPAHPRFIRTVWGVGYRFAEPEEL